MKDCLFRLLGKASKPLFGKGLSRYKALTSPYTKLYKGLSPDAPKYAMIEGMRLYLEGGPPGFAEFIYATNTWEPFETKILKGIIKEGMIALDIGANVGYYTLLFSKWVGPTGWVVAFEPDLRVTPTLYKNIEENTFFSNVTFLPAKVDNKMKSIDSMLAFQGNRHIDFIKVDTDGDEPLILSGMEETLKENPQLQMMMEYAPDCLVEHGHLPSTLLEKLTSKFKVSVLDGKNSKIVPIEEYELGKEVVNLLCTPK